MITAQWCTGKMGGRYRHYRCTKKKGKCSQRYLMEDALTLQVKEQLQSVSLPEVWADYMLKRVEEFEHDKKHASRSKLGQMKEDLKTLEAKLDALVDLYLNKDIEREIYLVKKDSLMRQKSSLQAKSSSARAKRKNWVEPLRKWILDSKRAGFLSTSENLHEIRDFLRSFGTNPALKDKTISISFCPPSKFARARKKDFIPSPYSAPSARQDFALTSDQVSECDPTGNRTRINGLKSRRPNR